MFAPAFAILLTGTVALAQHAPRSPAPPLQPPGTPGARPWPIIAAPPSPPPGHRPAPARRVSVPPVRARASLQSYFSEDDYPASALRARAEGATEVRITVGENGRVADCTVSRSSGNAALDAATCRILRSRARYTAARDSGANPVASADRGRIVWRVPAD